MLPQRFALPFNSLEHTRAFLELNHASLVPLRGLLFIGGDTDIPMSSARCVVATLSDSFHAACVLRGQSSAQVAKFALTDTLR